METTEKQAIFKMMLDAYNKTRQATEIYEQLSKMIGQGTVQSFLIDIIFDGDKLKYKNADDAYRKDRNTMDAEQRQLLALYNTTAMGISRARKAENALLDYELYLFMEFKMDKEDVKKKVEEVKTTTAPSAIPAKIEEITKGKVTSTTTATTAVKKAPAVHKDVKMDQVQAFVEKASEELILKALIEKAKKKGASALCQALEMILPLTQVSVNVVSKVETNPVSTESVDLLSMWK